MNLDTFETPLNKNTDIKQVFDKNNQGRHGSQTGTNFHRWNRCSLASKQKSKIQTYKWTFFISLHVRHPTVFSSRLIHWFFFFSFTVKFLFPWSELMFNPSNEEFWHKHRGRCFLKPPQGIMVQIRGVVRWDLTSIKCSLIKYKIVRVD